MVEIIILATAAAWLAVAVAMIPALLRVTLGRGCMGDSFRALLFFIAVSRIGISAMGFAYGHPAASADEVFARTGTAALSLLCALATLWLTHAYRRS